MNTGGVATQSEKQLPNSTDWSCRWVLCSGKRRNIDDEIIESFELSYFEELNSDRNNG
jgi:hypothetical protein